MSWAAGEFFGENTYDSYFTTPAGHMRSHVSGRVPAMTAALAGWPAVSPNVLAVGGTTLRASLLPHPQHGDRLERQQRRRQPYESEPSFQTGVQSSGKRARPMCAYDANPNTGFADLRFGFLRRPERLVLRRRHQRRLAAMGRPDRDRRSRTRSGRPRHDPIDPHRIYALPSSDFYDVTSGSNRGHRATAGYDEVTGLGAPRANLVIHNLVYGNGTTTGTSTAPTTTTTTPPVLTWNPLGGNTPFGPFSRSVRRSRAARAGRCIGCCRPGRPRGTAGRLGLGRLGGAIPRRPVDRAAQLVGGTGRFRSRVTTPTGPGAATRGRPP